MKQTIARFRSKVECRGADECWPWLGATRDGYGQFWLNGRLMGAHVFAVILSGRVVLPGEVVRHTCDHPPCCNDRHLLVGTHAQNHADMHARRRERRGDDHPNAKLSMALVLEARASSEPIARMARRLGVGAPTLWKAVRGETWQLPS